MPEFLATPLAGTSLGAWIIFTGIVLGMLAVDLLVFNRKSHVTGWKEALAWSIVWIGLAVLFGIGMYFSKRQDDAIDFATAYLVEKSLSVDNLFIFLVIFRYFAVPTIYQHRVLFWGILGALIMRAIMIGAGVGLLQHFQWLIYVFGGILIFTGAKMLFSKDDSYEPSKTIAYRITRKLVPMTTEFREERFFVVENGKRLATPLFLVLVILEATDLVFAVDSIPACLAISQDAFVVYTSNIFAILGLRALFFLLAGVMRELRFLKPALSVVLVFIGGKMIVEKLGDKVEWLSSIHISSELSLAIVGGILFVAVAASLLWPVKEGHEGPRGTGEIATMDHSPAVPAAAEPPAPPPAPTGKPAE